MIFNIIHSFVNIFAGGRSEIKTILFIIFTCFLYICYFLPPNFFFKKVPLKWKYFGITLLLMYLYGLLLHIFYITSNHFLLNDFIITGTNEEISSSTLWHTHIAKGIFGQFFAFFGKNKFSTMDAGGAYLGHIPSIIFILGFVLFVVIGIQAIIYFILLFKKQIASKNVRQKAVLIFGYAVVVFSLIKTSIDGGIFNPSFGVSMIFVIFFVLQEKGKKIIGFCYLSSLVGVILLFISLYSSSLNYGMSLSIAYIAALILLYTALFYCSEKEIRLQFFIPLLILFMSGWWLASARDRDIYDYSKILLPTGQDIYIYNEKNKEVEMQKNTQAQTVAQLSKKLNKNITYLPITVPGITCMAKAQRQNISFDLISTKSISKNSFISSPYMEIKNENSVILGRKWETKFSIYVDSCLPEVLSVIDGELQKNNINDYLIINPSFDDSSNN